MSMNQRSQWTSPKPTLVLLPAAACLALATNAAHSVAGCANGDRQTN